jgi:hypothetical protein
MKKVLAAIAVVAVSSFGSPVFAAHEIADVEKVSPTGTLQVYGAAKLSVDLIDTGSKAAGTDTSLSRVSSNSSRLGKGAEELATDFPPCTSWNWASTWTARPRMSSLRRREQLLSMVRKKSVNTIGLRSSYVGLKSICWAC